MWRVAEARRPAGVEWRPTTHRLASTIIVEHPLAGLSNNQRREQHKAGLSRRLVYSMQNARRAREEMPLPDDVVPRLRVEPLVVNLGLRKRACEAIKRAITEMDIYGHAGEIRLDERQLSQDLGVSRTPIREALTVLEQEGFVRAVPRRGIYVVRKTKREVIEMITVWAAMESLAARLACERASDAELHQLRQLFAEFGDDPSEHISEYSQANMAFHRTIIRMG